jgi:hypothetical protein
LDALASASFSGHEAFRAQAQCCLVREADDEGQLDILVLPNASRAPAGASEFALAEACFTDADGVPACFILHADNGRIERLEKYKADSSPFIVEEPAIATLSIRPL